MKTCMDCEYYNQDDQTCRRYPPVSLMIPYIDLNYPSVWWPSVTVNHWCGEFKERSKDERDR